MTTGPADPPPLTDRAYHRLCALVQDRFGIHLAEHRQALVVNRLGRHLRDLGLDSYDRFVDHVEADATGGAAEALADLISTHHTYLFREPAHFDFLRTVALPDVDAALARRGEADLRVWCCAASTGEEPYSIAMTMLDALGPRYALLDAGLLATDLSVRALRRAADGVYGRDQLRHVPAHVLRYCQPLPGTDQFRVAPEVRREVLFRRLNLVEQPFAFRRPFHAIFCRNVMIYFDAPARRRLAAALYAVTAPGGYLFVGHAEPLPADATGYRSVRPSVYQRPEGSHAARR